MDNNDDKVRLAAIENLYYQSKSLKEVLLVNFNNIFESMLLRASDVEDGNQVNYTLAVRKALS